MSKPLKEKFLTPNIATIPRRLEVKDRRDLIDFPQNILFGTLLAIRNIPMIGTSVYEPDIESFKKELGTRSMTYYNTIDGLWVVVITKVASTWKGQKLNQDAVVLSVSEKSWKEFFYNLTVGGLSKDEPFSLESGRSTDDVNSKRH